jgi:anti-anti-sigma regulatory factor
MSGSEPSSPLCAVFTRPPPTLALIGEADESNYPQLTAALTAAATAGDTWLLVDLAGLTYCDLAGLRAIISLPASHEVTARRVVLRDVPGAVRDALGILGWDESPGVSLDADV